MGRGTVSMRHTTDDLIGFCIELILTGVLDSNRLVHVKYQLESYRGYNSIINQHFRQYYYTILPESHCRETNYLRACPNWRRNEICAVYESSMTLPRSCLMLLPELYEWQTCCISPNDESTTGIAPTTDLPRSPSVAKFVSLSHYRPPFPLVGRQAVCGDLLYTQNYHDFPALPMYQSETVYISIIFHVFSRLWLLDFCNPPSNCLHFISAYSFSLFFFTFCLFPCCFTCILHHRSRLFCLESRQGPHEERLISEIFDNRNYQNLARPVGEETEPLEVNFGISLQQIIEVVRQRPLACACAKHTLLADPRTVSKYDVYSRT